MSTRIGLMMPEFCQVRSMRVNSLTATFSSGSRKFVLLGAIWLLLLLLLTAWRRRALQKVRLRFFPQFSVYQAPWLFRGARRACLRVLELRTRVSLTLLVRFLCLGYKLFESRFSYTKRVLAATILVKILYSRLFLELFRNFMLLRVHVVARTVRCCNFERVLLALRVLFAILKRRTHV